MARPLALVDTSFLYALFNRLDKNHKAIQGIIDKTTTEFIVPDVAIGEVAFLLMSRTGPFATARALEGLARYNITIAPLEKDDLPAVSRIMERYADVPFDFVDCCIMMMTEKWNIERVYTFDRRDFSLFKPRHCDFLQLLP